MIRWLWKVLVGVKRSTCSRECQWEPYSQGEYGYRSSDGSERTTTTVYCLRCKTCGDMKNHKVRA